MRLRPEESATLMGPPSGATRTRMPPGLSHGVTLPADPRPEAGDLARVLASVPATAGVAQLVGPGERSLLIGQASNIRRWAAAHLGQVARPSKTGRPPVNLSAIAKELRFLTSTSGFHQRLLFERTMETSVPLEARRDLKRPGWLKLDQGDRFPRVVACRSSESGARLYGPFRDLRAAANAREMLHKRLPLRPCDYVFEPDPALPLGLGCVYAQVRTCAAPCLARVSERDYASLAREAAELLRRPLGRAASDAGWLPSWVGSREQLGLVIEEGSLGIELYAVNGGRVIEAHRVVTSFETLAEDVSRLCWEPALGSPDDRPWLLAWLHAPKRKGGYLAVENAAEPTLAERIASLLKGSAPPVAQGEPA